MAICTATQCKAALRIDGDQFDADLPRLIDAAQSAIEHECGLAYGSMSTTADAGAVQAAIAIVGVMLDDPTNSDSINAILRSYLLDRARSWA